MIPAADRVLLGVDGGGTRSRAVLVTEDGTVIGAGTAAGANVHDVGAEEVGRQLAVAAAQAWEAAGAPPRPLAAGCFALAGLVTERDRALAREAIGHARLLSPDAHVMVDNDGAAAVAGAHLGDPGLVLISGTGSACYGRGNDGSAWRASGWGPWMGDEGSGTWIGREGLTAVVKARDGRGPPTALSERLLAATGCGEADDLMYRVYVLGLDRRATAALAPQVLAAAAAGDAVAEDVLRRAVEHLLDAVEACRAALSLERPPLALTGGVALAMRERIEAALGVREVAVDLVDARLLPPFGAALLALEQLGPVPAPALEELQRTSDRWQSALA